MINLPIVRRQCFQFCFICLFTFFATSLSAQNIPEKKTDSNNQEAQRIARRKMFVDSLRSSTKSFPVLGFFDDTLFMIYHKIGSIGANERATIITDRVKKLKDDFGFTEKSLTLQNNEVTIDMYYGEQIIMSVSEDDAIWNKTDMQTMAAKNKKIIDDEIFRYKKETAFFTLAKEIGFAALILSLLLLAIFYVAKFFRWIASKTVSQEEKRIKGWKIKNYTLLDAKKMVAVFVLSIRFLKWIIILLLIYFALPFIFGLFPWTKNFAQTLFSYILDPIKKMAHGFWDYLPNLFTIVVIFLIFHYLLKAINFLRNEIEQEN